MSLPTFKAFSEPSARVMSDWTPGLIRSAEIQADGGNLRYAADLCEALFTDDHIQGVLPTRTRGLLGLPLTFEESGDGRRKKRAVKALQAEEDWWASYPEAELGKLLDWGIMLGVGLGRNDWTPRESGRVVPKLENWHSRWLRFDSQSREWRLTVNQGDEITIAPGDGQWILYTPQGAAKPWNRGAWRALSRWWLLKQYARDDFARHSEVHGTPLRVGMSTEGANSDDRAELAADLGELGRDTSLCLPNGYDLKLVEATAKTYEMFKMQIELANLAMSIALVGQNLTTNVQGGSLAAAKVHQQVRGDLIRSDGETASTTLHDQSLVHWAEFNFGDRNLAPWPQWATDPPEDSLAKAKTREAQGQAISALKAAGVKLDSVLQEFGLELAPEAPPPDVASPPALGSVNAN